MEKKVFLDDLPRYRGKNINWKESANQHQIVKFIYYGVEGEVEIVSYKDSYLYIKYLDKPLFKIKRNHFVYCKIGKLLGKYSGDFKVKIGQIFKDDKRDLTITDREYRKDKTGKSRKWYKYACNKCGNEDWIVEGNLTNQDAGCNVCTNTKTVLGINTIWDTDGWMCNLGVSEEDAKTHTYGSSESIITICPYCGRVKELAVSNIYKYKTIHCSCGDGVSYPEKVIFNILEQLKINFITQLSKRTFKWCSKYYYDFYIPSLNVVIETHGEQHYIQTNRKGARNLEEEMVNDKIKKELAIYNGVKEENYISLDCRKSELEFIKNNILNSNLAIKLDLSIIDWNKVEEFALSNRVKEACDLWNSGASMKDISITMGIGASTSWRYLNKGSKIGWCDYCGKEEMKKGTNKIPVEIFKNEISLGIFESIKDLSTSAIGLFGVSLDGSTISKVCKGKIKLYKGYSIRYIAS